MPQQQERIDHVPGQPEATRWRRAARQRQSDWREAHGWPAGVQRVSERMGGGTRPLGSRLDAGLAAQHDWNFISDAARSAVADRIAKPQPHQTLDTTRLYSDLLSSMPMCFNLFGPLWADPDLATIVVHRWFPELCPPDARVTVGFEWSPGRADEKWLGDRTAFDAVLHVSAGVSRLIGVETKYHEYPIIEPTSRRRDGVKVPRVPRNRYIDLTERAELFATPHWLEQIWGTELEQIWRDHMLAIACRHASPDIADVRYVLVAPEGNPPWATLAAKYSNLLAPAMRKTFEYRSLEVLLDSAADVLPGADVFRSRYLDIGL
ncbi:MAG: hypothetical protein JWN99_2273 [Ilumatobacteraceae bacterium]|nr:hypothetical protein [Ilumatobacteraceae bacterium]